MKKLISILLAAAMVMSFAVTAMAFGDYLPSPGPEEDKDNVIIESNPSTGAAVPVMGAAALILSGAVILKKRK